MAEKAIKINNADGTPNNDLTKENVNFKIYDGTSFTDYIPYGELNLMNNFGNYVANGIEGWQQVGLFIDDVQQFWWGLQYIGEPPFVTDDELLAEAETRAAADQVLNEAMVHLAGNEDVSDVKRFITDAPQSCNAGGTPRITTNPADLINYHQANLTFINNDNGLLVPYRTLIVDSSITASYTNHYKTIQEAINYAHAQNPLDANEWYIFIMPGVYAENLTFQPKIHLYGIGKVQINGTISGADASQHICDLLFVQTANFTLSQIKAKNCIFRIDNSDTQYILTLTSSYFINCLFLNTGADGVEFKPTTVSGGNNKFLQGNVSNLLIALLNTDIGKLDSLESYSATWY